MDDITTTNQIESVEVSKTHEGVATRFEKTSQKVTEELSLKQIVKIFTSNWALFIIIFAVTAAFSFAIYTFRTPFVSTGSIVVNDAQNSSLQSFSTQFFGLTKTVADGKKNNSPLQKHLEFLKTEEFFQQLLVDIKQRGLSGELTISEKKGFENFKKQYLAKDMSIDEINKVIQQLDSMAKIKLHSDFEIKVSFLASEKETALFLTNVALNTIAQSLKDREYLEIIKVDAFIKSQREATEKNMLELNKQLADFQNKPENLISLSSKDKVGEYLSELMVRKNEVRMKIAENQKMIVFLSQGLPKRRESQLYGNGGRIQALHLENEMHQSKLSDLQRAIDQVSHQAKSIPVATQVFDELKKKSEIEFKTYKELTEALSKVAAQKLSIQSRFEVLEKGRFDKVFPQVSLIVLLMLSLVISQVLGSLVIYIMYVWDSNSVTAHSSRDIVIIDSHSLDPRVIMENTKIRFRLRHGQFTESQDDENESQKKLSFKIFNTKSAGGDSFEV